MGNVPEPEEATPDPLETTAQLLQLMRDGDDAAQNRLLSRYLPILRRWAHNRLPHHARDLSTTDDLVQRTVMKAFERMDRFEYRREGAFLAWLRQIFVNELRDEIRRVGRRPSRTEISPDLAAKGPSPLADVISQETFDRYEAALNGLRDRTREAVLMRIEFGYTYAQIAEALQASSENAVRMLVSRALFKMAQEMRPTKHDETA